MSFEFGLGRSGSGRGIDLSTNEQQGLNFDQPVQVAIPPPGSRAGSDGGVTPFGAGVAGPASFNAAAHFGVYGLDGEKVQIDEHHLQRDDGNGTIVSAVQSEAGRASRAQNMWAGRNQTDESKRIAEWDKRVIARLKLPEDVVFPPLLRSKLQDIYLNTKGGSKAIMDAVERMAGEIRFVCYASPEVKHCCEQIEAATHSDTAVEKLDCLAGQQVDGQIAWSAIDSKMNLLCAKPPSGNNVQDIRRSNTLWQGIATAMNNAIQHKNLEAHDTGNLWINWFTQAVGYYLRSKTSISEVRAWLKSQKSVLRDLYFETKEELAAREEKKNNGFLSKYQVSPAGSNNSVAAAPAFDLLSGGACLPTTGQVPVQSLLATPQLQDSSKSSSSVARPRTPKASSAPKLPRTYIDFMNEKIDDVLVKAVNPLARFQVMKANCQSAENKYKWAIDPILSVLKAEATYLQDKKFGDEVENGWEGVMAISFSTVELDLRVEAAKKQRAERLQMEEEKKKTVKEVAEKMIAAKRAEKLAGLVSVENADPLSNGSSPRVSMDHVEGIVTSREKSAAATEKLIIPRKPDDADRKSDNGKKNGGDPAEQIKRPLASTSNAPALKAKFDAKFGAKGKGDRPVALVSLNASSGAVAAEVTPNVAAAKPVKTKGPKHESTKADYTKCKINLRKHCKAVLHPIITKRMDVELFCKTGPILSERLVAQGHDTHDFDCLVLALKDMHFNMPKELSLYALRSVILEGIKTLSPVIMSEIAIADFESGLRAIDMNLSDLAPLLTVRSNAMIEPSVWFTNFDVLCERDSESARKREEERQKKERRQNERRQLKKQKLDSERQQKRQKKILAAAEPAAKKQRKSFPSTKNPSKSAKKNMGIQHQSLLPLLQPVSSSEVPKSGVGVTDFAAAEHVPFAGLGDTENTLLDDEDDRDVDLDDIEVTDSEEEAERQLTPHQRVFGGPDDAKHTQTLISLAGCVVSGQGMDQIEAAWRQITSRRQHQALVGGAGKRKGQRVRDEPLPLSVQKMRTVCLAAATIVSLSSVLLPQEPGQHERYHLPTSFVQYQARFFNSVDAVEKLIKEASLVDHLSYEITSHVEQVEKVQSAVMVHLVPDIEEVVEYIESVFSMHGLRDYESCNELFQHYNRSWGHLRPLKDAMFSNLEGQLRSIESTIRYNRWSKKRPSSGEGDDSD